MSKWKRAFAASAVLACANLSAATAQVRQPMPLPPLPYPENSVKQAMPLPGTPGAPMPVLKTLRVKPLKMYNMMKRPFLATTAEGHVAYLYRNDNELAGERIVGPNTDVVGKYIYARDGRFERIDYTDGTSISASYGDANELVKLTSSSGRAIRFSYHRSHDGTIRAVTPTANALEFHSAVALLRLKQEPVWWRAPVPAMENLNQDDGKNGKTTSTDNPWNAPEYPHDPFPDAPKSPDGTPIIEVSGSPEPPDTDPGLSPLPIPPVQDAGVDIAPDGGSGGRGGNTDPGIIKDLDDFATFKDKQKKCHQQCFDYRYDVDQYCKTGPNYRAFDQCVRKSGRFYSRCVNACDKGDWDHDFQHKMTPQEKDFFPWLSRTMDDL